MIIFDLKCARGHEFEGWFKSRDEFHREKDESRLSCPICTDEAITVLPSGGHISRSSEGESHLSGGMAFHKAVGEFLSRHFEDVGNHFAEEAVKMHLGEADHRNIRGTLTTEEEQDLVEDGIEFYKVHMPKFDS